MAREEFESMIKEDKFIEWTQFASNYYGTSKMAIEAIQNEGKWCILDLDWQGVKSVRRLNLNARVIFIKPPSMESLRNRLSQRGSESTDSLDERLKAAEVDMKEQERDQDLCDLVLINDDINLACSTAENFIFNS